MFVVATSSKPWDVNAVLLSGVFADAHARQLCALPTAVERARFLESCADLSHSGADLRALAADERTKDYSYADLQRLCANARVAAARTLLKSMGSDKLRAAAGGVCEIDLSEPTITAADVARALQTTQPTVSSDEHLRYTQWKP